MPMFNQLQNNMQQDPRNQAGALTMPEIVQAFQNDPRARLAATMMQNGSSTAPTAGGGWAWADGLARALSGVAGGYITKQRNKAFQQDQSTAIHDMATALMNTDEQRLNQQHPAPVTPPGIAPDLTTPPQAAPSDVNAALRPLPSLGDGNAPSPEELARALSGAHRPQQTPAARPAPVGPQAGLQPLNPGAAQTGFAPPGGGAGPLRFLASSIRPAAQAAFRPVNIQGLPPRRAAIGALGNQLQSEGFLVGENTLFGSFNPGAHRTGAAHGDHMIDVNLPGYTGNRMESADPAARARMDQAVLQAQQEGYRILWNGQIYDPHGSGPSRPIPVRNAHDRNPSWQHLNHAHFEAPASLAGNGAQQASWWRRTGAAPPAASRAGPGVAGQQAVQLTEAPLPQEGPYRPQPVQQITTPEPTMPSQPQRPDMPNIPRSERGMYARELMASGNPYLIAQARQILDAGMGEDNAAAQQGAQRQFEQNQAEYGAGLQNFYGAQQQQRGAAYDARQAERGQGFQQDNLNRQQGFQHDERLGTQNFQGAENSRQRQWGTQERLGGQEFQSQQNDLTRQTQRYEIDQRRATAQDRRANFFSTPQGARMYEGYTQRTQLNDTIINGVAQFVELNESAGTGGAANNIPIIGDINRIGSEKLQQMEAITAQLAPILRQAGSGAMSDRDLANFRRSLPSIQNSVGANREIAQRLTNGLRRVQTYEEQRLNAIAEGNVTDFESRWRAYVNSNTIDNGVTFEQWGASVPRYNAQGVRQ